VQKERGGRKCGIGEVSMAPVVVVARPSCGKFPKVSQGALLELLQRHLSNRPRSLGEEAVLVNQIARVAVTG